MTSKLQHEVFIRDKQISILHDRLIVLDAELRAGKTASAPSAPQRDSELLLEMRLELEAKVAALQGERSAEQGRWMEERRTLTGLQEAASGEVDRLKVALADREKASMELSEENTRLAGSVRQTEWENSELRQKVARSMETIETLNHQLLEEREESGQVTHLQTSLSAAKAAVQSRDDQIASLRSEIARLQSENATLEQIASQERRRISEIEDSLRLQVRRVAELEEGLRTKESEFAKQLAGVKSSLEASIESLRQVWENLQVKELEEQEARVRRAEEALQTLRSSLHAKESERAEKERQLETAVEREQTARKRTAELEAFIEQQKERFAEQARREKTLGDELAAARKRNEQYSAEIRDKAAAISKVQSQNVSLLSRVAELKSSFDDCAQKLSQSESAQRDVQMQLSALTHEKTDWEQQSAGREQKLKQLLARVKSLEEEVWNKDSESLKRESAALRYITQVEELKKALQQAHAKLRTAAADQLAEVSAALEKKDSEIALLKEMVRSAKIQAKGELARKKKPQTLAQIAEEPPANES